MNVLCDKYKYYISILAKLNLMPVHAYSIIAMWSCGEFVHHITAVIWLSTKEYAGYHSMYHLTSHTCFMYKNLC